tara:strand:- start:151 stop:849 length:699 start_codon:yes stop_codon:yes gene_type:complete
MGRLIGSVGLAPGSEGTELTTKGDLHGFSSSNTRIPIGDNDQVLTADSAQALGLKWATAGGGDFVKIAQTVLGSAGTSLKIADQDIDLDPTASPTYTQLYVVGNLLWDHVDPALNVITTGTINDGSSFIGVTQKMGASVTSAVFNATSTIPISGALGRESSPTFFMWIGVGYESDEQQSLMFNWHYTGNDDTQVMGGGRLTTTASSTFTDIDLIFSNDILANSTITLYGVKA